MTKSLLKKIGVTFVVLGLTAGTAFAQVMISRVGTVNAFGSNSWNFVVPSYETVRVVVDGDGDTDLDCYVYDAVTGDFLGSDTDGTDYCIVNSYSRSGRIRVDIDNLGSVWNRYQVRISR
jgi:hypothetical protein